MFFSVSRAFRPVVQNDQTKVTIVSIEPTLIVPQLVFKVRINNHHWSWEVQQNETWKNVKNRIIKLNRINFALSHNINGNIYLPITSGYGQPLSTIPFQLFSYSICYYTLSYSIHNLFIIYSIQFYLILFYSIQDSRFYSIYSISIIFCSHYHQLLQGTLRGERLLKSDWQSAGLTAQKTIANSELAIWPQYLLQRWYLQRPDFTASTLQCHLMSIKRKQKNIAAS